MDALVGLRPAAVDVVLGDYAYTIPELPAADWIAAVLAEDGGAIVPGLLNVADRRLIWGDFARGGFSAEELAAVERDALAAVAGRPWWEADRLVRSLAAPDNLPTIHGELMLRGLDLERITFAAALNAVYAMVRKLLSHDEAALARFDTGLKAVPPGVAIEELYDQEEAAEDFLAAMAEQQQMFG
jgi:hypothetical protein